MKFYVTIEGVQKLKRSFLNIKLFSIINVQEILENFKYDYNTMNDYEIFIVNKEIICLIKNYSKSKRIRGIIYSNPNLNELVIENLKEIIKNYNNITEFVLIDEYNLPQLQHFYHLFNEIIFFPSIKKIRIIEAVGISKYINKT